MMLINISIVLLKRCKKSTGPSPTNESYERAPYDPGALRWHGMNKITSPVFGTKALYAYDDMPTSV